MHCSSLFPQSDGCRFEAAQGFFLLSSTFQTHIVQLIKPSQVYVRPTGIQALPSPVNSTIIKKNIHLVPLGVLRDNKSLSKVLFQFILCSYFGCENS